MISIGDILSFLDEKGHVYRFIGNPDDTIDGFSSFQNYREGSITWLKRKMEEQKELPVITCIVLEDGVALEAKNMIICKSSRHAFFQILEEFWGKKKEGGRIGEGTTIAKEARIDPTVSVGANCVIRGRVEIKKGTVIEDCVVVDHCVEIGEDCIIHSGTVIGADGFGYMFDEKGIPQKITHFGQVRIGNRVELGANVCVDRGTIDDTEIQDDVKIDDLVQIAHNARIGAGAVIVSGATICGSVRIGEGCYIAPNAVVKNGTKIGRNSFVDMGMVVHKDVADHTMYFSGSSVKTINVGDYRKLMSGFSNMLQRRG